MGRGLQTYIANVHDEVHRDDNAHAGAHGNRELLSRPTNFPQHIVGLLKPGKGENDSEESMGVAVSLVGAAGKRLVQCGVVFNDILRLRQATSGDTNGDNDDQEHDSNLHHGKHVVQPDSASARDGVDEARKGGHGESDTSHGGVGGIGLGGEQDTVGEVHTVAGHVSEDDESDAEDACREEDGVLAIGRLVVNVREVVEIATTARDTLLDAIDDIARNVETVLDVDVNTTNAIDYASDPEEQCCAGASCPLHDTLGRHEDAGA